MRDSGFTLIELMVTIAIMAILAAVALPSYNDYVRRSQTTEATTTLSELRTRLEQYYQDNRFYAPAAEGGASANDGTCGLAMPSKAYFTYSCATRNAGGTNDDQVFTLTATGKAGGVVGSTYTLDQADARATTQFKGSTVSKACWLIRGDEC